MNFPNLIKTGETDTVEFKKKFDERTIESAVTFTNKKGGTIFIGVSDQNHIKGIKTGKETINRWTNQITQSTDPRIIPEMAQMHLHSTGMSWDKYPSRNISLAAIDLDDESVLDYANFERLVEGIK